MDAGGSKSVESSSPAGPDCRALLEPRRNKGLVLQSVERRVHSTGGDVAFHALPDLLQNRSAVGSVSKPDDCEQYRLFERSESLRHMPTL